MNMKQYCIIGLISLLFSCSKSGEEVNSYDSSLLLGKWLETSNFGQLEYKKTTRFGDFEKGLVFYDDGTLIGRSESSICIGDECLMENYNGRWERTSESSLNFNVESLKGQQNLHYQIIEMSKDRLVLGR